MPESSAQRALATATLALLVAVVAIALFLPPLAARTLASTLRTTGAAAVLVLAMLLHWVSLGVAAHRLQRPLGFWVGLSVLLFPIGSAAALLLMRGANDDGDGPALPAPAPGRG